MSTICHKYAETLELELYPQAFLWKYSYDAMCGAGVLHPLLIQKHSKNRGSCHQCKKLMAGPQCKCSAWRNVWVFGKTE